MDKRITRNSHQKNKIYFINIYKMCKKSIKTINKKIEDEITQITEKIFDMSGISIHIQELSKNDIEPNDCLKELEYIINDLTKSLKIIKRLKLLKTISDYPESNIEKYKMHINNPENMTSDDEKEFVNEITTLHVNEVINHLHPLNLSNPLNHLNPMI